MAEHVALLDFGSNAVRFVHARLSRRGAEFLREGRVRARLASGTHGSLSLIAIEQTLRAAERFLRSVREFEPRVLAVATASVRDAPNAQALLGRLNEVGVSRLRILSGIEEATLVAESALRSTGLRHGAVRTAGLYSDLGLFTCDPKIGEDVTEVFNSITGYMRPRALHHLMMAPLGMREGFAARVRREAAHARAGRPARMILKMNSLVDPVLIEELYAASRAGAEITLIVRGICCLRPGVAGQSETIRVVSIIDRNLEHARIYYFENAGQPEYWLSSADWMPRNLDSRVELAFPVLDPRLQEEVRHMLELQIADRAKARELLPDGRSRRLFDAPGQGLRSQDALYTRAEENWTTRVREHAGNGEFLAASTSLAE